MTKNNTLLCCHIILCLQWSVSRRQVTGPVLRLTEVPTVCQRFVCEMKKSYCCSRTPAGGRTNSDVEIVRRGFFQELIQLRFFSPATPRSYAVVT